MSEWDSPETLRLLARDRSTTLSRARDQYRGELEDALERLNAAELEWQAAKRVVSELRSKLAPLADQIAHYEACAATEDLTWEMLIEKPEGF